MMPPRSNCKILRVLRGKLQVHDHFEQKAETYYNHYIMSNGFLALGRRLHGSVDSELDCSVFRLI